MRRLIMLMLLVASMVYSYGQELPEDCPLTIVSPNQDTLIIVNTDMGMYIYDMWKDDPNKPHIILLSPGWFLEELDRRGIYPEKEED